jgi:hypothetical protein
VKVGVSIGGIASSLAADAVVRLRDRIEREEELERLRRARRRNELQSEGRTSEEPGRRRR